MRKKSSDDVLLVLLILPFVLTMTVGMGLGLVLGLVCRWRFFKRRFMVCLVLLLVVAAAALVFQRSGELVPRLEDLGHYLHDFATRAISWFKDEGAPFADYDWPGWSQRSLLAIPLGVWAALLWPNRLTPESLLKKQETRRQQKRQQELQRARHQARSRRVRRHDGAYLGVYAGSRRLWNNRSPSCVMPPSVLGRHVLSIGATGTGKTVTLKRIIQQVLALPDWQVIVVDGKGDLDFLEWFERVAGLANDGRMPVGVLTTSESRGQVYDGWRGNRLAILNRLAALLLPKADQVEAGSEYYRTGGMSLLDLAVQLGEDAPRSWEELVERLDLTMLKDAFSSDPVRQSQTEGLDRRTVHGLRMRAGQLAGQVRRFVDTGGWALDDGCPCYFLLDTLSYQETANALMRFIVQDVMDYVSTRKVPGRRVLVVVDEFSAVPVAALINFLERARSLNGALVLSTQDESSFGRDMRRFLTNFGAVVLHRYPEPERICQLAGSVRGLSYTLQIEQPTGQANSPTGLTGRGSATTEPRFAVHPDQVRQLEPGEVFIISDGHSARVQISMPKEPLNS